MSTETSRWHILNSTKMTLNIEQPSCLITNTSYSLSIPILFMVASSFTVLSADFILIRINHLFFFTKITFLFYWFIKLSHWQNYLKKNIVLLKWVHFYHIYKKIWPGSQCGTLSCLMSYIICLLCNDMRCNHYNRLLCGIIYIAYDFAMI